MNSVISIFSVLFYLFFYLLNDPPNMILKGPHIKSSAQGPEFLATALTAFILSTQVQDQSVLLCFVETWSQTCGSSQRNFLPHSTVNFRLWCRCFLHYTEAPPLHGWRPCTWQNTYNQDTQAIALATWHKAVTLGCNSIRLVLILYRPRSKTAKGFLVYALKWVLAETSMQIIY